MKLGRALEIQERMAQAETLDLVWLARAASKCNRIVELGSLYGVSARAMLDNSRARIWCIDSWRGPEGKNKGINPTDQGFQMFLENMKDLLDRVVVLKMYTREAAGLLPMGCFDMVYIDADHSYQSVKFDILHYAPLVRLGGLLCGHDYVPGKRRGLVQAVNEVVAAPQRAAERIWWTRREEGWLLEELPPLEFGGIYELSNS